MEFKVLNLCVSALFLCLLKPGSIKAQCTQPSFESKKVVLTADYLSTQSFADGSTVKFECIIGHKPVDSKASRSVTCEGNQWTNLDFSCTKKSCGPLPEIIYGKYVLTGIYFGDSATPVCNKGYTLAGQGTPRICRDQGWDGQTDPLCEPVKCSPPLPIENGQLVDVPLESYDYLQAVSYRCNPGLNLIGQSTLHCSENGNFQPDPPKCVGGCPTPNILNAKRIGGRSPPYKLNNFIEYKCEDGYTMKGESYIVCKTNGWSPEPPQCIAQCTQPSFESKNVVLTSDYLLTQSFDDGSTVTFECIIGHKPVDSKASRSVTCEGNHWTNLDLNCTKKSCGPLSEIIHGKYVLTGTYFGDSATPVCNKGYMLAGQGTPRICRDQGWDGQTDPLCEPVKCSPPLPIENGQLVDVPLESYDYLQAVSYRCNPGLNLIGQSTVHCSENGTFQPDPPKCFGGCPTPNILNAKRAGGRSPPYKLNNFIEYKCEDGYTMKGESYIVCKTNGWSPEPPQCTKDQAKTSMPPWAIGLLSLFVIATAVGFGYGGYRYRQKRSS
ncbi:complement receptor type 2-like isoform X2 [Garra rufa]|uniref:complement receptor type 2-like isoform X2 n=1 Tax=Garra rufa TaxID=137080 RepID=UPI003CCED289